MESYYYSSASSPGSNSLTGRASSPASSVHSVLVLPTVLKTQASGEELSLNREACAAVCAVERGSVRSGTGRATPVSSLAPLGTLSSTAVCLEASKVAQSLQVTGHFCAELLPILAAACQKSGQRGQVEENVSIATPVSVDWEDVILYEGFTVRITPADGVSSLVEEKALFVQFPRADGWLKDDFIPAVVALIELAEAILDCDRLLVCVKRNVAEANSLVRSLMYAGFSVSSFCEPSDYLVLEYETE